MTGLDFPTVFSYLLGSLGAAATGLGIYKFGTARGAAQTKTTEAMEVIVKTLPTAVEEMALQRKATERVAQAAEENSKWVPLLESIHEDRRALDMTLRAMSRKINTLMRSNEDSTEQ